MIAAAFASTARFVWSRNRVVLLSGAAIYAALFVACEVWSPAQVHRNFPQSMGILLIAPVLLPLFVLVGSVNPAALKLGGRQGHFPRAFYTLPIRAHEMVMPFIVYSVALAAGMWLLGVIVSNWRVLMLGPPGTPIEAETISYWVPFLTTSGLVWFQAIIWTPVTSGWKRIVALLAVLLAHCAVVFLYVVGGTTQAAVIAASVVQIPFAFFVAVRGVAQDRSGIPDPHAISSALAGADEGAAKAAQRRPLRTFSGGMAAQLWFEKQVHHHSGMIIAAFPILLLVLVIVFDARGMPESDPETFTAFAGIAISLFAWTLFALGGASGFVYASFRGSVPWQSKEAFTMPPFFGTLPFSTGDFVWAKLASVTMRMMWITAIALVACAWIAYRAGFIHRGSNPLLAMPVIAFVLILLSGTASLMGLSLAGRAGNWLNYVNLGRYAIIGLGGAAIGSWWGRHHEPPAGLAEVAQILAIVKIATLVLLVRHVGQRNLLSWGRLAILLALWLATFGALLTTALTFVPEGKISMLTLVATLIVLAPVQGTIAAPLALHLNRVR
jgi:hypothetical protein